MGFLRKLLGGGDGISKTELIRALAKRRISTDPVAKGMGYDESMVDSLGEMELMGTPEAALVTIVETYAVSRKSGTSEKAILDHIEAHRSQVGSGQLPKPLTLDSFIRYRFKIEFSSGPPISDEFISEAIATTKRHYGLN
ncbi:hypothetical protein ABA45_02175 [Marinobacter psychrophilus]|jgi:hypothetical protein|uniref:Uncharacterized protein n=1 Tax=Marinobacter psychrophilus TaxID=330734 RepID=A0A0H4HXE1_9GAMM|nr:hypothetical protein ABA45_02175 [Marinobacter psychrophilus]